MDADKINNRFSIIIPVHNAENTLRACVERILLSQYPAVQVVLIENNSTDKSWDLCCDLQAQYQQVVCVQTKKVGVSAARNLGLQKATGDVIGFCDADDQYTEDCFPLLDKMFRDHSLCAAVVTGYQVHKTDGTVRSKHVVDRQIWRFDKLADHVLYDNRVMGSVWNKFFRKEVIQGYFFDEELSHCEDMHFLVKLLSDGYDRRALILSDCTYEYFENPESATSSAIRLFTVDNRLKYMIALDKILQDCKLKNRTRKLVGRAKYQIAYQCGSQFVMDKQKKEVLRNIMKKNLMCYLTTIYVEPVKTLKVLIKQILGRNR